MVQLQLAPRRLTPPEVGQILRISPAKVIAFIKAGQLRGVNVAHPSATKTRWRVSETDLAAFEASRGGAA
jgi:hypothetical protein